MNSIRLIAIMSLLSLASTANAVCPTSIAGNYIFYGAKSNPTDSFSLGSLATLGAIPKGSSYGPIYVARGMGSGTDDSGSLSGHYSPSDAPVQIGQYSYNAKCFGLFLTPNSDDASTWDVHFMYVSDSGAQIQMTFGPAGVAKDSAGNPLIPSTWTKGGNPGVFFLRKQ
jgi:hypothetical protein